MTTTAIEDTSMGGTHRPSASRRSAGFSSSIKFLRPFMIGGLLLAPSLAMAEEVLNSGDTAWMLTATALVLFMTVPGLALFYAGMVRSKNVLSVLMQCFAITALMSPSSAAGV